MTIKILSPEQIMERVEQAFLTLCRQPPVIKKTKSGQWPDIAYSDLELLIQGWEWGEGRWRALPEPRTIPTSRQLDDLDEVLRWLSWVPVQTARIILAYPEVRSYRELGKIMRLSHETCRERHRVGIAAIAFFLSQGGPKKDLTDLTEKRILIASIRDESRAS